MKSIFLVVFTLFVFKVQAHEFHTPNYCHPQVTNFCAHIGHHEQPKMGEAFEFVVDLVASKADLAKVTDVKVELWMPDMGHGSAPVQVKRLDLNHFQVTEAYFVMAGLWNVNIEVLTTEGSLLLSIPFEIK